MMKRPLLRRSLPTVAVTACLAACTGLQGPMSVYQTDPLVKILSTDSVFTDTPDTLCVARGENATFQFVVTATADCSALTATVTTGGLGDVAIGWVHEVYNTNPTHDAPDMLTTPDNMYPDPIIDDQEETISPDSHRILWVDIDVPRGTAPGLYRCQLTLKGMRDGREVHTRKRAFVKVYPVDLPEEQGLKVVNWYSPSAVGILGGGEPVAQGSDRYLELLQLIAETAARYGQNCWNVCERPEVRLNADSTDFVLDFTYFDRAMEMLIEHGNLKYFCNSHFGGRFEGAAWSDPMGFNVQYVEDKTIRQAFLPATDPRVKEYVQKYYIQIEAHFREKGWLDICYQHIADEPDNMGTPSQQSWSSVAAMVKEAAPGLRTVDASFECIENQDVSVVLLGPNIESLPALPEGSERWMYTCTGPQGKFANRFIQLPLLKTRILHWINFKYDEVGYLHWGYNYWQFSKDPLHDATPSTEWPGGDCFIIYPGQEKVYPSIRLCAMREGIRDYDLLRMVEAKDPERARAFVNSIILGPDSYEMDTRKFYEVRKEMLSFLSEQE